MKLLHFFLTCLFSLSAAIGWFQDEGEKREIAREQFEKLDADWDHFLSESELSRFRATNPPKLEHYDFDDDQQINFEEFFKLVRAEVFGEPIDKAKGSQVPLIEKQFDLNIRSIDFQLQPIIVDFSYDGKRAVVVGIQEGGKAQFPNTLIMVDLSSGKIIKTQMREQRIKAVAIDDDFLFVQFQNKLAQLDRDSLEERARVELWPKGKDRDGSQYRVDGIHVIPGGRIALASGRTVQQVLSTSNLTEVPDLFHRFSSVSPPRRLNEAVVEEANSKFEFYPNQQIKIGQCRVDCQAEEVVVALDVKSSLSFGFEAFPPLESKRARRIEGFNLNSGRRLNDQNQIVDCTNKVKGAIGQDEMRRVASFFSPNEPIVYCVYQMKDEDRQKATIEARQLKDGRLIWSQSIDGFFVRKTRFGEGLPGNTIQNGSDRFLTSQLLQDKIVFVGSQRLIVSDLPRWDEHDFDVPLQLVERACQVVSSDDTTEIAFESLGGKGGLSYELLRPFAGVSIDKQMGLITIDGEQLFDDYFERKGKKDIIYYAPKSLESYQRQVFEASCDRFRKLLGRPLSEGKSPFRLRLEVVCEDESGEVAALALDILVEVPQNSIEVLLKKGRQIEAERQRQRTESVVAQFIKSRVPEGIIDKVTIDADGEIDFTTHREPTDDESDLIEQLVENAKRRFNLDAQEID